jgi:hypothetical protein
MYLYTHQWRHRKYRDLIVKRERLGKEVEVRSFVILIIDTKIIIQFN